MSGKRSKANRRKMGIPSNGRRARKRREAACAERRRAMLRYMGAMGAGLMVAVGAILAYVL